MALLLRRTVSSAAKSGSRRRLSPFVKSNHAIRGKDSWFVSVERSFWYRDAMSPFATTARSTLTSYRDQEEEQQNYQASEKNPSLLLPSKLNINSSGPTWRGREYPQGSRYMSTDTRSSTHNSFRGRVNHFHCSRAGIVRYTPPPASIRTTLGWSQCIAAERAATDLAIRALNTWTNQYQNNLLDAFQQQNTGSSRKKNHQVAFFSTNFDGGPNRDQYNHIARTGIRKSKIPTPESGESQRSMKPEDVLNEINKKSKTVVLPAIVSASKAVMMFLLRLPFNTIYYMIHPAKAREKWDDMKQFIKEEVDHYWVGTKLLWADLKTARALIRRTLRGSSLTRRERKQLLRTISDLFRLVPFSMFLIIPLMEFALPFALKLFPNLLPSTFQDSLKAEENMKRELQMRIAMAKFFQETLEGLAKEQKRSASHLKEEIKDGSKTENVDEVVVAQQEESAQSMLEFLEKARNGEIIPNEIITKYAHYFRDDLTLDNMPRMQLINMCKYMSIPPYGSDSFLRFQLRHRMRSLREDDQRILWEGIDSLTKMELREACQERGMRSTGLSKDAYKRALQQWLDLSVKQNVPTSLLIMSRTFFLREEMFETHTDDGTKSLAGLADAISGLDKEVVNEVILDVATSQEKMSDPGVRKIKLEVLMKQNELIEQEQAEREEAAKKKKLAEKEKLEAAKKKEQAEKEILETAKKPEAISAATPRAAPTSLEDQEFRTETKTAGGNAAGKSTTDTETKESKSDEDLSTAEMDAISQLVSADPVSRERADLESIKAAMSGQTEKSPSQTEKSSEDAQKRDEKSKEPTQSPPVSNDTVPTDAMAAQQVESATRSVEKESKQMTSFSSESTQKDSPKTSASESEAATKSKDKDEDEHEDPIVARLKRRIESMVDKIEVQLSDVQVKIGDKLHVLDKDMDGILTVEEIAKALQQVLKRKITYEESYEIAQQIDENKDGVFTVQELIQWVETNQLVKFVEEGRDADMDRIIEKQSSSTDSAADQSNEEPGEESAGKGPPPSEQQHKQ